MNVLQVNARLFPGGGDAKYMFNLAAILKRHGHNVFYYGMENEFNIADPNSDLFPGYIDFRDLNSEKSIASGFKVLSRAIYSSEARQNFRELLQRAKPHVVHLHNIHAHLTPSIILEAKSQNIPVVWTMHDYKLICPNSHFLIDSSGEICEACGRSSYYMPIVRRCKKGSLAASAVSSIEAYVHLMLKIRDKVDAFVCPSQFLMGKLLDRGFPPEKLHHIPNVLLDTEFHASDYDDGYLLFLGKLEPIKGIEVLLQACCKAPQVEVIVAGSLDNSRGQELFQSFPPNAKYVGVLGGEKLHEFTSKARALVTPSICYENQPYSILEAFANAKPVIASDLAGMTELVADKERGLLVAPGDAEELAMVMEQIASDPSGAKQMGMNAFRYALANHSPESHYQRISEIYWRLLEA